MEGVEDRSPPPSATPMDLITNPNIRKKFFILAFDWVANAVVYNGLSYNTTNLGVSDYLAFFIGKSSIPFTLNCIKSKRKIHNIFGFFFERSKKFFFNTFLYRRYRGDTVILSHMVRDGQVGQAMGIVCDHDAGWTGLRVLYVRA